MIPKDSHGTSMRDVHNYAENVKRFVNGSLQFQLYLEFEFLLSLTFAKWNDNFQILECPSDW